MMEVILPIENLKSVSKEKNINLTARRRWTAVLYLCGISGVAAVLTTFVLCGIAYYEKVAENSYFNKTAGLLIVAALLLMMLGAHALDKISEYQKADSKK